MNLKKPLTYSEQVLKLKEHGIIVNDDRAAEVLLSRVNYYRFTGYVCRHTFCSKMARSGMNPKNLQYIMGHSEISITLDTYTHLSFSDARKDFKKCLNESKSRDMQSDES